MKVRVGEASWYSLQNTTNAAGVAPTGASNGMLVPRAQRNQICHILSTKTTTLAADVYGWVNGATPTPRQNGASTPVAISTWAYLDSVSFSKNVNESCRVDGVTAFQRIQVVRTDAVTSNLGANIYVGFSEA